MTTLCKNGIDGAMETTKKTAVLVTALYNLGEFLAQNVNVIAGVVGIGLSLYVWYSQREKNKREREAHELYKREQALKFAEFERRAARETSR